MSPQIKPLKLYGENGLNPAKVAIILEELSVPYEVEEVLLADIKKPYYTAINPNGRLPAIYDPNTNITLWESGAIIEYLIERYDTDRKISFAPGSADAWHTKQWLFYQVSGQGPYYGQASWFKLFAKERIDSAVERYAGEVDRVSNVLNDYLALQEKHGKGGADGPWLVGGKCTYADLSFITWQRLMDMVLADEGYSLDKYPHLKAWYGKMTTREKTAHVLATAAGRMK